MSAWTDLEQPQSPYHLRQQLEQHRYATLFLQLEEPKDDDLEYNCFYESSSVDATEAVEVADAVQDSSIGNGNNNHTSAVISRYNGRLHEDFLGEKMLSLLTELNFSSNNPINLHSIRKHYLQHGGYLDFQDEMLYHKSALLLASSFGHDAIIELLLDQGVNLEVVDEDGNTALLLAANNGYENILRLLLSRGANINHQNHEGLTSLSLACFGGYDNCVEQLLLLGADPNLAITRDDNYKGYTAMMIAAKLGFLTLVEMLYMYGADVERVNNSGYSAVFVAFLEGNYDIVRYLTQHCHAKIFINPNSIQLRKITAKIRAWMKTSS